MKSGLFALIALTLLSFPTGCGGGSGNGGSDAQVSGVWRNVRLEDGGTSFPCPATLSWGDCGASDTLTLRNGDFTYNTIHGTSSGKYRTEGGSVTLYLPYIKDVEAKATLSASGELIFRYNDLVDVWQKQ